MKVERKNRNQTAVWGRDIPSRGSSQCKGPEASVLVTQVGQCSWNAWAKGRRRS